MKSRNHWIEPKRTVNKEDKTMKEIVQFTNEKPKKSGEPFWNVKAGDVLYNVWEKPSFQEGDLIEFEVKENEGYYPSMVNIKKIEDRKHLSNNGDAKSKSMALLACLKSVGSAAQSMNINSPEELVEAAMYCYRWFLDEMENTE